MVSERSALLALASLVSGLIIKLEKNGTLTTEEATALVEDTLLKSVNEPPKTRTEIREFMSAMFSDLKPE